MVPSNRTPVIKNRMTWAEPMSALHLIFTFRPFPTRAVQHFSSLSLFKHRIDSRTIFGAWRNHVERNKECKFKKGIYCFLVLYFYDLFYLVVYFIFVVMCIFGSKVRLFSSSCALFFLFLLDFSILRLQLVRLDVRLITIIYFII